RRARWRGCLSFPTGATGERAGRLVGRPCKNVLSSRKNRTGGPGAAVNLRTGGVVSGLHPSDRSGCSMSSQSSATTDQIVYCRGERFRVYLDRDTIQARVAELGAQISRDYEGKAPILIGVLNGAFMFIADLMRA